jgi:UDP-N-acetylglucosamine 2-epimerase (non-hydrolysing)
MKVMTIFGTRPEGIKMAPIVKVLKQQTDMECVVVNTAQHREMLDQVLELFNIHPDYDMNLMKENQTPAEITARILTGVTEILEREKPDLVLVHGDTATTFASALAAFLKQIPVGHVEAGLRTNNIYSPFPEEANRQLVSRIANIHFSATESNRNFLENENISPSLIHVVGNSVIDALLTVAEMPLKFDNNLEALMKNGMKTILVTTHRRENIAELGSVYRAINRIANEFQNVQFVFPVHKNPVIREILFQHLEKNDRIHIIEPQSYEVFAHLMKSSFFILTDSGGIQEEAPALGKPVLVVRKDTERSEGVESGTLRICGTDEERVYEEMKELLVNTERYKQMSNAKNPYGNGDTSERIIKIIRNFKK